MPFFRGVNKFKHLEIVPGGSFVGMGYHEVGNVYYVDYLQGSDGNDGRNPRAPLQTIAAAFLKVVGYSTAKKFQNDYIFVVASKDQDDGATITPVSPAEARWHLVGISNPQATFGVVLRMDAANETAACITLEDACGNESEIAGINFGGGATGAGGLSLSQIHGVWVHHCTFGHSFCGDTPAYGIYQPDQTNNENCLIEDNFFYGSGDNAKGKITVDGIYFYGATPSKAVIIRNNVFMGIPGIAINITGFGSMILNNVIKCDAATAGSAITLQESSAGCVIDGNHAGYGGTDMGVEPYVDDAAGGANANTWLLNYNGITADQPA